MSGRSNKLGSASASKSNTPEVSKKRIGTRASMEEELNKIKEQIAQISILNKEVTELRIRQTKFEEMEQELKDLRNRCDKEQQGVQPRNYEQERIASSVIMDIHRLNLDIKVPKFCDEDKKHPIEFLNELENYLNARNIIESTKMLVVESSLEGRAKDWYSTIKSTITTFESFKENLKKTFFSIPNQIKIKEKWQEKRFTKKDNSLEMYFAEQLKYAQFFEPKMINFEVNFKIAKQLPWRAREALVGANFEDSNTITSRLQYLDLNQKEENENDSADEKYQIRKLTVRSNQNNNRQIEENNQPGRQYDSQINRNNTRQPYRDYQQTSNYQWGNRYRYNRYQNRNEYDNFQVQNRNIQRYPRYRYENRSNPRNSYSAYQQHGLGNNERINVDNTQQWQRANGQSDTNIQAREMPNANAPWFNEQKNNNTQPNYNSNRSNAWQNCRLSDNQQSIGHLN